VTSVKVDAKYLYEHREEYCEHCLKIVPFEGGDPMPLVFKPEQKRLAAAIDLERRRGRPPRIIILKSRRVGASTMVESELFRECHLGSFKQALVVAHSADSSDAIFKMSQLFYDELPPGMKPPRKYATKKLIHFSHNGSRMQVVTAGEARGYTAQYLHISELAFIDNPEKLMDAILMTAPKHPQSLIVAESTPNGIGNYFHNLWVNAVAGRNDWIPFFSPWFDDPTATMKPWFAEGSLSPRDAEMKRKHSLTLEQVAWYVWTRENTFNGDQRKMDQECASDPQSCFLASGSPVFDLGIDRYLEDLEVAKRLRADGASTGALPPESELEPVANDKKSLVVRAVTRGRWRIYRPPQARHLYIVGVDTASGEPNGDYTPITVFNRHTLDYDAVFYAKLHPDRLAAEVAKVGWWYNLSLVIGEANNHGVLFFDELIKRLKYPHIWFRRVNEESVAGKVSDKPGFWTAESNRNSLFNVGRRYVREHSGKLLDPNIIKEMSEMFYDDSHRPDHPKNGYSDGVTAFCLPLYAHMGTFEGTLQPLPLATVGKAITLYRDNLRRRNMGLREEEPDLFQMTMDEIEAMDRMDDRRQESRKRSGLGGYR
jgi:hypothetical protein